MMPLPHYTACIQQQTLIDILQLSAQYRSRLTFNGKHENRHMHNPVNTSYTYHALFWWVILGIHRVQQTIFVFPFTQDKDILW